ncbi:hypothetical protein A6A12_1236 [Vibrio anguillarum]|nr:hypothetical protein A6A12_1236 [Vibrio anguillarum]
MTADCGLDALNPSYKSIRQMIKTLPEMEKLDEYGVKLF